MRFVVYLFALFLVFTSCRKGKVLPNPLYVHFEGFEKIEISPNGDFPPFNPLDLNETSHPRQYVNYLDSSSEALTFKKDLSDLLKKNNVFLTSDTAAYEIKLTVGITEGINRQSYADSCMFMNPIAYVYYSDLHVYADVTLYKYGQFLKSWSFTNSSTETVRSKTDGCNKPKIRSVLCGTDCLMEKLEKQIRYNLANELYFLEGY